MRNVCESGKAVITVETKISDIIANPAFGKYGRFLFMPEFVKRGMWLKDYATQFPLNNQALYARDLNRMVELAERGMLTFHDIYTAEEKRRDPDKANTALLFFHGKSGAPFAVANAGGAFYYVGLLQESIPHCLELSRRGYNAFALYYRVNPGWERAYEDLARALVYIFDHAVEFGVSTENYSLWGASAGARMAASLGSYGTSRYGEREIPKPVTVVMQYTGHTEHTKDDPPTFVAVGDNDWIADWRVMKRRVDAIAAEGTATEFYLYPGVGHGFGIGTGTAAEGWINDAIAFWERNMKSIY